MVTNQEQAAEALAIRRMCAPIAAMPALLSSRRNQSPHVDEAIHMTSNNLSVAVGCGAAKS
jgi:hypothetical protein